MSAFVLKTAALLTITHLHCACNLLGPVTISSYYLF